MENSKKIMFLSFIPLALVLVFILYLILPLVNDLNMNKQNIENQKIKLENAKIKIQKAEQDQKLANEIIEMQNKLGIFDLAVPEKKELEILLVDIEKFGTSTGNKILGLTANTEKTVEINTKPKENSDSSTKSTKESRKTVKKLKNKENQGQFILQEIPIEIKVLGYYPDIIKFIQKLENYQRKIVIEGIEARDYNKDAEQTKPRVEMKINAKVFVLRQYTLIEHPAP
ncbi:MAG: type 4a pilus biogenesis protein PilO [Candidatus Gastranaerophilaceae bacterium]|jgi:Tfp pilus assembly protein PilO